jgi:hypothetical protein
MPELTDPSPDDDSLDLVERVMAMEEALISRIQADPRLTPEQREWLIREIEERIERGEFGEDDDTLAALVRKLPPRGPRGQAGAAAKPDEPDDSGL